MATVYQPPLAPAVERALLRWPNVPAAYGWLRLDRRARWWLPEGQITHKGTIDFLHRHYGADEAGRWFVQNGPQQAFVTLDLAPWVFSLDGTGQLASPAGRLAALPSALVVTPEGDVLVATEIGLGNVLDRDLEGFTARLRPGPEHLDPLAILAGTADGSVYFNEACLPVLRLGAEELPGHFGFQRNPGPDS